MGIEEFTFLKANQAPRVAGVFPLYGVVVLELGIVKVEVLHTSQ